MSWKRNGFLIFASIFGAVLPSVHGACYDPSPAFPLPQLDRDSPVLRDTLNAVQARLDDVVADASLNTSSFAIEVTSSQQTLWSSYHTALVKNEGRPGAGSVSGSTRFRIASITKSFTVLAILQQHAAGNLSLDDPVVQYIERLQRPHNGSIPWKDITLRTLASQLSGIPRECTLARSASEEIADHSSRAR